MFLDNPAKSNIPVGLRRQARQDFRATIPNSAIGHSTLEIYDQGQLKAGATQIRSNGAADFGGIKLDPTSFDGEIRFPNGARVTGAGSSFLLTNGNGLVSVANGQATMSAGAGGSINAHNGGVRIRGTAIDVGTLPTTTAKANLVVENNILKRSTA